MNKKNIGNEGITLIALVVTIVVLIILAVISINVVLGENGIIRQAERAKDFQANAEASDNEAMDIYDQHIANALEGNGGASVEDNGLPAEPKLTEGMTKVKYNSTSEKWEKVTEDSKEWYNYANKEWANVVLGDATFNTDGTLDESKPYTQLVWIPRYAYKITSQYHTAGTGAGDIEVVFIDTDNKNKDGSTTYSTTYPNATAGGMSDYVVHPAFDYGGAKLAGFWMGKFESSHTGCTTDVATGQVAFTGNEVMTVKANVTSWRNIKIGDAFTICLNMNKAGNPYGLSTSDSVVDPHMVKNSEWGAVAYLSKSKYGKQTEEVYINNSSTFITGNAGSTASASSASGVTTAYNTEAGMKASTTGNVTGIYDMAGGNWERVAAYVNNGHANLTTNGADLVNGANKYKNVYSSTVTDGSSAQEADYALSTPANGHYGEAVYETSGSHTSTNSWYSDYSNFPNSNAPFFDRGGGCDSTSGAGVFYFGNDGRSAVSYIGFRVVVPVL